MGGMRQSRVIGVTLGVLIAFSARSSADHPWNNYHWARQTNPFTLLLGNNLSGDWPSYLATASSDWSHSTVLDTEIVAGRTKAKTCRPTSGRVEVCNSLYGANGWLGIAQIWVSGSHITQGVVKVNDTYFRTSTYNKPAWKNLVMCQEVGHTLGLDHQDENFYNPPLGTCMDYSSDPEPNQHPNSHDLQQLEAIYAHVDSTTTVGSASATGRHPQAMRDLDFAAPNQWGRLMRETRGGRVAVYELDFGGGHRLITFVIWA